MHMLITWLRNYLTSVGSISPRIKANESNRTIFLPDEGGVVWGRDYLCQARSSVVEIGAAKQRNCASEASAEKFGLINYS